ncbi:hypothetical protein GCM10023231_15130 [Olivibacter ginsenosidimutans]|uniref:Transcriptional repressor n=1 Tax=Olivibacter ginsenosidimutans TaxID=1176537 RepID=A0ABP9B1J3_9SPHI
MKNDKVAAILADSTTKLGRKPKALEEALLALLAQKNQALTGEDIFLELYNGGMQVSYPTVYNTLRRLKHVGILQKRLHMGRKFFYSV